MNTQILTITSADPLPQDTILVIGNFDAVHKGHAYLIGEAKKLAEQKNKKLAVLTFEPHPRRLFRPEDSPFRVTPFGIKADRLSALDVDIIFCLPFTWDVASQPADQFITTILKEKLAPDIVVIGEDFHFGHNRGGNKQTMEEAGLKVVSIPLKADSAHGIISATRIRGLIQSGHIDEANALLGWNWVIEGKVQKGDQRGRELGYPTANIPLGETIHPAYGVYATWVKIDGESDWRMAATNIGIRPMFEVETALIEAHILDFSSDLYGKTILTKPVAKLRGEEKFDSLEALIAQIEKDCNACREILKPSI